MLKKTIKRFVPARIWEKLKQLKYQNRVSRRKAEILSRKSKWGVNKIPREEIIIVSLTSYPARYKSLHWIIKSILSQTYKPDRIILYLSKNDCKSPLPRSLKKLRKYGLEIEYRQDDLKPHKKYYYAIKENPEACVVTFDDDFLYPLDLLEQIVETHKRFPKEIIISRGHRIKFKNSQPEEYLKWDWCIEECYIPRKNVLGTNGAGTLFPPRSLTEEALNIDRIKKLAYTQDDLWLKVMEIIAGKKTVMCNAKFEERAIIIKESQKTALCEDNVEGHKNDWVWKELLKYYNLNEADFADR